MLVNITIFETTYNNFDDGSHYGSCWYRILLAWQRRLNYFKDKRMINMNVITRVTNQISSTKKIEDSWLEVEIFAGEFIFV